MYEYLKPLQHLNVTATWAAIAMLIGQIPFLVNILWTALAGKPAPANPWNSYSLEWRTASPPPHENFAEIPTVHSRDPFWDQKYEQGPDGRPVLRPALDDAHEEDRQPDTHGIHMPGLSYFPFVTALGLVIVPVGIMTHISVIGIGLVVTLFGIYGWAFEPAGPDEPASEES